MRHIIIIVIFISAFSCKQEYTPKPRGYFRIDLPEKAYKKTPERLPYSFEYPKYADIEKHHSPNNPYWINIVYPKQKAKIYLSYKKVDNNLKQYLDDSRTFVYKHTIKADAISETPYINKEKKVYGLLYEIKGDAASNVQFFVTDSTTNFLRGSLYFNVTPNKDSLAPVIDFIHKDIIHMVETFEWK